MRRETSVSATSFNTPSKQKHRELWANFVRRYGRRYAKPYWRVVCLPSMRREEIELYRQELEIAPQNIIGVECVPLIFRMMQSRHRDIRLYRGFLRDFVPAWMNGEGLGKNDPWFQIANADFSGSLFHNRVDLARLMLVLDPRACVAVCATRAHDLDTPLMGVVFQSLLSQLIGLEKLLALKSAFYAECVRLELATLHAGELTPDDRAMLSNSFLRELAFLWLIIIGLLCHPFRDFREPPDFRAGLRRVDQLLELTSSLLAFTEEARRAHMAEQTTGKIETIDRKLVGTIIGTNEWRSLIGESRVHLIPSVVRRIKYNSRRTLVETWFLKFSSGSRSESWSFAEVLGKLVDLFQHTQVEFIELDTKRSYTLS